MLCIFDRHVASKERRVETVKNCITETRSLLLNDNIFPVSCAGRLQIYKITTLQGY